MSDKPGSLLAPQYINGVYLPVGLLLAGTAIIKKEWLPIAAVLGALLGVWKVFSPSRKRHPNLLYDGGYMQALTVSLQRYVKF